jgi:hypothetical protein
MTQAELNKAITTSVIYLSEDRLMMGSRGHHMGILVHMIDDALYPGPAPGKSRKTEEVFSCHPKTLYPIPLNTERHA